MWKAQDPENVYEGEVRYENNYSMDQHNRQGNSSTGNIGEPSATIQTASNSTKAVSSNYVLLPLIFIGISVIVSVAITSATLVQIRKSEASMQQFSCNNNNGHPEENTLQRSCLALKKKGISKSGIYKVGTKVNGYNIEVFCDMETDGGGWTLVASIHEDDINEKCGVKDRWATDISPNFVGVVPKTAWENKLTFGQVQHCTTDDYKNSAYYELHARDIMIWHVPSGSAITNMQDLSTLQYRSDNNFLQGEGENLYHLFKDRYPVTKIKRNSLELERKRGKRVLDALYAARYVLKSKIPNWQNYKYSGSADEYRITDSALYSTSNGNEIYFYPRSRGSSRIQYEKDYEFTRERFFLVSKRSQPFLLVAAIANEKGSDSDYFEFRVSSYLLHGYYKNMLMENNISLRNFRLQYIAQQYYHSSYPSICEFRFIILNRKEWGSLPPTRFYRKNGYAYSGTKYVYSTTRVEGNMKNIVMGYLLLTRTAGKNITLTQTDAVASVILNALAPLDDLFNEEFPRDGLSVPVRFDKGSPSTILNMVPPIFRHHVEPGYMQFRAYNATGYPSALCPGMRMKSFNPEYMCVGGVSSDFRYKHGTCGDFAGWAGRKGDSIQTSNPMGYAHSQNDISSAILIFYR